MTEKQAIAKAQKAIGPLPIVSSYKEWDRSEKRDKLIGVALVAKGGLCGVDKTWDEALVTFLRWWNSPSIPSTSTGDAGDREYAGDAIDRDMDMGNADLSDGEDSGF